MNVTRILKWLVVLCVVALPVLALRDCWSPVTNELSHAVSPDDRWRVVVARTIYASVFSDPAQTVRIGPAGLSRFWTPPETLAEVNETGDKPLNIMLDIRWLDPHTLQISVSKRVEKFYQKKFRYEDIAIQYTAMSAER